MSGWKTRDFQQFISGNILFGRKSNGIFSGFSVVGLIWRHDALLRRPNGQDRSQCLYEGCSIGMAIAHAWQVNRERFPRLWYHGTGVGGVDINNCLLQKPVHVNFFLQVLAYNSLQVLRTSQAWMPTSCFSSFSPHRFRCRNESTSRDPIDGVSQAHIKALHRIRPASSSLIHRILKLCIFVFINITCSIQQIWRCGRITYSVRGTTKKLNAC